MRKILLIAPALVLLACDLGVGDGDITATDWDWALAIARSAVNKAYGEHWYIKAFGAEFLDKAGALYDDPAHPPVWEVFYSDGSNTQLRVLIHADGRYTIFEQKNPESGNLPLCSTYDSDAVESWLRTASEVYRELTGLADDACYDIYCYHTSDGDYVSVGLFDADLACLLRVVLLAQSGDIVGIYF
ncbi:MAG TPA: hypothetical protein ENN88_03425 [Candidatus Coatesbacteria bacterium]|nr:hypothetical protein [Candidatus Coatesbacteria bacterium]